MIVWQRGMMSIVNRTTPNTYRVMHRATRGWEEVFEGTRYACSKHIRNLAKTGHATENMHITIRSVRDFIRSRKEQ